MGVQIPVGSSQAVMRFSVVGDAEPMVCVLGFTDTTLSNDPVDIANRFTTAQNGATLFQVGNISNQYSVMTTFVTTMLGSGPVTIEDGTAVTGTNATLIPLPNNCSVLLRKNTALGGRKNRGRMYLPPMHIAEGDVTPNGVITTAVVTALQTKVDSFRASLLAVDLDPKLLHSDGTSGTQITSFTVQPKIATQRQRMRP